MLYDYDTICILFGLNFDLIWFHNPTVDLMCMLQFALYCPVLSSSDWLIPSSHSVSSHPVCAVSSVQSMRIACFINANVRMRLVTSRLVSFINLRYPIIISYHLQWCVQTVRYRTIGQRSQFVLCCFDLYYCIPHNQQLVSSSLESYHIISYHLRLCLSPHQVDHWIRWLISLIIALGNGLEWMFIFVYSIVLFWIVLYSWWYYVCLCMYVYTANSKQHIQLNSTQLD